MSQFQFLLIIKLFLRVVERGRVKCGQYWPLEDGRTEQHGYFLVRNTRIQGFQDFKLSHLELYNTQVNLTNVALKLFKIYKGWHGLTAPGYGIAFVDLFIKFLRCSNLTFWLDNSVVQRKEANVFLCPPMNLPDVFLVWGETGHIPLPLCELARLWGP